MFDKINFVIQSKCRMTVPIMLKKPSGFLPVVMSLAALALVLAHVALFGAARETDEGAAAHLWQLLMAGQVPIMGFFAIRWLPAEPRTAAAVLVIQVGAA